MVRAPAETIRNHFLRAAAFHNIKLQPICNSDRTFNHCSPSVKIAFGALRRARQTRNKNNHSAEYVQSAAEHILNRPTPRQGLLFKNPYDTQGVEQSQALPPAGDSAKQKIPEAEASGNLLEVTTRFELVDEGFADPCLTTWPRHHIRE